MRNDPSTRAVIQDLRGAFIPNEAFNALKDLFETMLDQRRADLAAGRLTNVRSIALVGGSGSGKSTLIRHLRESRSDLVIAEGEAPCEFASQLVPSPATMKFVGTAILHALGYPLARDKSAPVIWGMVADQLQRRKTLFLHLDEAQDLARFQTDRERQSVVNTLKSMMENRTWPVSLILSGTPELKKIINQDPQLARRIYPVAIPRLTVPRHVNAVVELTRRYAERGTLTVGADLAGDEFARRLLHAGDYEFGLVAEIIVQAACRALGVRGRGAALTLEDFGHAYRERTGAAPMLNPFLATDFVAINVRRILDDPQ
ncbi:TniB family NTP-binding protein [Rhodobacter sp. 24-YEA-8]|uniref:TniB family NTP-binding protein n=1 Tax=Rhodobacter sp. 24-YEA-8 TaxID=1884310 RepID=UPI000894F5F9|nr:TniB family NTP-binding protein [Rhodobacter sp. 24-YEA-8]SEB47651.1 TniB protein [Rhodobacter sp. 24-YEA-8]